MSLIKSLDEVTPDDAALTGGKATQCARLKQAGFPVPDGFVVLPGATDSSQFQAELTARLRDCSSSSGFAVRSSAAEEDSAQASFAGIHETWLNVRPEDVAEAIARCRASAESARAIDYRRARGMAGTGPPAAVLVQSMVLPISSGVAFTLDPVTGDSSVLVISSAWGVGEAVVGGYVAPDQFRVRKDLGSPVEQMLGDKRWHVVCSNGDRRLVENDEAARRTSSLTGEQLGELSRLLLRIERHYGAPQDVEWCFDGRGFWIVQSRPITALPSALPQIEWTRANTREVLPDLPSPQVTEFVCWVLNRAFRATYGRLLAPEAELGPIAKAFYGRVYFNLSQFRHICRISGTPEATVLRAMGHSERIRPEEEAAGPRPWGPAFRSFPDVLRLLVRQVTASRRLAREVREIEAQCAAFSGVDPSGMSDSAILAVFDSTYRKSVERIETVLVLGAVTLYEPPLRALCARAGVPYERLLYSFLAVGEKTVSSQQAFDLLELAHLAREEAAVRTYFLEARDLSSWARDLAGTGWLPRFLHFLERYGHRGIYESEWSLPCFAEDPTPLLWTVQAHVAGSEPAQAAEIVARQQNEWVEAWSAFQSGLGRGGRLLHSRRTLSLLRRVKRMGLWRECYRSELVRLGMALRPYQRQLAGRLQGRGWIREPGDYFFLTSSEAHAALNDPGLGPELLRTVERRKAERRLWEQLEMPLLMRESELPALLARAACLPTESGTEVFRGQCLSPGYVEGEIVVIREPTGFASMKPGAILVAPATDPSWTPLFTLAAGLIVEIGGVLSHAATVAREYGLPAIANVKDATRLLHNGQRVRLDATAGVVTWVEPSARYDTPDTG